MKTSLSDKASLKNTLNLGTGAGGSYSKKNEIAHLKRSLDENLKLTEKVKSEHSVLKTRVQHIMDYLSSLEDKLEENLIISKH